MPTNWSTANLNNKDKIPLQTSELINLNRLNPNQMIVTRTVWSSIR